MATSPVIRRSDAEAFDGLRPIVSRVQFQVPGEPDVRDDIMLPGRSGDVPSDAAPLTDRSPMEIPQLPSSDAAPIPQRSNPLNNLAPPRPSEIPPSDLRSPFDQTPPPTREAFDQMFGVPGDDPLPPPTKDNPTRPDDGPSLGDMLQDSDPISPSDIENDLNSPFERDDELRDRMRTVPGRGDELGMDDPSDTDLDLDLDSDDPDGDSPFELREDEDDRTELTCDQFRDRIAELTIDQVSLDISPPFRPDEINQKRFEKLKRRFDSEQSPRQFRNRRGEPLMRGRLIDLAYGKAILETESGGRAEVSLTEIGEADLSYINEAWGLPKECLLARADEMRSLDARGWTPLVMTWKASNLCHSPLYFEDVNLERYGHTHGPVLEPLVQSAHFFGNVLVLPYKMGVHHPRECIYTLGYYRPGSCAPWITPPVPISLRGALNQTAVMVGGGLIIP